GQRDASGKSVYAVDEREAQIVRTIFELVAAGHGYKTVRDILVDEKAASPRGRGWTAKGVRVIVARDLYRGRLVYGKTQVKWRGGDSRQVATSKDNWIVRDLPSARIVTDAQWNAAHARLARTTKAVSKPDGTVRPASGLAGKLLLSGLTICGRCHGPLTVINSHAAPNTPPTRHPGCSNPPRP